MTISQKLFCQNKRALGLHGVVASLARRIFRWIRFPQGPPWVDGFVSQRTFNQEELTMMAAATAVSGAVTWVGSESANAVDCKSILFKAVGSTPTLPTNERDSGSNPALAAVV